MRQSTTPEQTVAAMRRVMAIVPAAGRSRRMGRAKLLTLWRARPLIAWTIAAWRSSGVDVVLVTVHPDDDALGEAACECGAEVVVTTSPPAHMKDSVRIALDHARAKFAPSEADVWMLAPADMPELSPAVISRLLAASDEHPGRIIVPQHAGRRGHPVLFPWPLAAEIATLGEQEGVNTLLRRHPVVEIEGGPDCLAADIDTPDDLARLQDR